VALWLQCSPLAREARVRFPSGMGPGEPAILLSTKQKPGTWPLSAGEGTRRRKKELAILLHYAVGSGQCPSLTVVSPTPCTGYGSHLYLFLINIEYPNRQLIIHEPRLRHGLSLIFLEDSMFEHKKICSNKDFLCSNIKICKFFLHACPIRRIVL